MANLEQKLGELSGKLDSLIPALQVVDQRLDGTRDKVIRIETDIKNLQTELTTFRKHASQRHDDLYKRSETVNILAKQVEELVEKSKDASSKTWDVVKIVLGIAIAAVIGAVASLIATGAGG